MNSEWFSITDLSQIECGDIFETPSKIPKNSPIFPDLLVGAVKHVGIFLRDESSNELLVAHNPFGGRPEIVPYEKVFSDRFPERIKKTGISAKQIREKVKEIEHIPYSFWGQNCEGMVRHICNCDAMPLMDQRIGYALILVFLIILVILLLIVKK